ncbi:uncharacterized protein LOC142344939 [Convolutriloba macropyga]|uniref:uncharacterized protein LOC142344939 n=1 Tax=Convolutriloba macropyga TaxID=536237 RepID=UPI003F51C35D
MSQTYRIGVGNSSPGGMHIHRVPGEVLEVVFWMLDPLSALACEQVCVRWRDLMSGYWLRRLCRVEYNVHKFSLEAFGHLVKGEEDSWAWWPQIKRFITLENSLDKIHQNPIPKKEYQFKLSNVGIPSTGGRHVCGGYLLVINLVANSNVVPNTIQASTSNGNSRSDDTTMNKLRWTVQSVNNTNGGGALGSTSPGNASNQQRKIGKNAIWQLNIYHILTGKLVKTVPNINMVQPCIAGCCFDDVTPSPQQFSNGTGSDRNEGAVSNGVAGDNNSGGQSTTSSILSSLLKRGTNSSRSKNFLNTKISAIVLFERDRATTQSKIVVVKAPFGMSHLMHQYSMAPTSMASMGEGEVEESDEEESLTANEFLTRSMSDHSNCAAGAGTSADSNKNGVIGLREYFFSTEFKKSQSTIRVFDHLLVVTFRHEEKTQTELQVHHILDYGHKVKEWKRWTVPEQVWRVEFKDEHVFALACRTKVLFFNVLHGSYQTIYSTTSHIPKTRLFIGMHHVMFASDYGSKPAVILPILNSDSVHVAGNLQQQSNHPLSSSSSMPCGSSNSTSNSTSSSISSFSSANTSTHNTAAAAVSYNTSSQNSSNSNSSNGSKNASNGGNASSVRTLSSNSFSAKLNIQCNSLISSPLQNPRSPLQSSSTGGGYTGQYGIGCSSPPAPTGSCEAVMIDSIKWRDLSFKSASIGSTVLVDSPDESQLTLMNVDHPLVRVEYPHPSVNTRDCELCGVSLVGHHLLVVLRNFRQNMCHVIKMNLLWRQSDVNNAHLHNTIL